ncbi:MAG: STAS/SEC14 domain-containing protein [Porticoccus sp.]|nr:STAS/SEC14 domain-containing protein [Porticoccus sp.]
MILQPHGQLNAAYFQRIIGEIDPYIENVGDLKGVIIEAESFPGWDDLSAFVAHFRFVKNHRNNVKRLAVVSNDHVMAALPLLVKRFLIEESRHFSLAKKTEALAWVSQLQGFI